MYRKKPCVVNAEQFTEKHLTDHLENDAPLPEGVTRNAHNGMLMVDHTFHLAFGDWIVSTTATRSVLSDAMFTACYEPHVEKKPKAEPHVEKTEK